MEFEQIYITYAEGDEDIFFSLEEGYIYTPIIVSSLCNSFIGAYKL